MDFTFESGAFLLSIAAVVAMLSRRLRLPYSVGLVAAGIGLALLRLSPRVQLTKDLLFDAFLPPLIFEAALFLPWKPLRRDLGVILLLATVGVALSAGITGLGMFYFAGWQWQSSLLFGILIAATDPVSVIATFKEARVRGRLLILVESESLFNDGTAAVAFAVALELVLGHSLSPVHMIARLLLTAGGGVLCGAIVAGAALLLMGRTEDHLVEMTFTTVAAYGSFLLAERFHLSGVLATLTAGLMLGNFGPESVISERGKLVVASFWEYAAFVANSFVFLLMGMRQAHQNFVVVWLPALLAIMLVTLGRAVAVYPCCALFARSPLRVQASHQHILFWGGLRGALALALALALPETVPQRDLVIAISFVVVAFSVFVQGLTIPPLLRALGEIVGRREN
ncbi:MAG TPA: cation:proton antiporter [Bryobacteraceae bacterium]|jgi:CPA1 family monovalent cation:H+ antiporter|nr:cation:proton antiporter [Bryobacteraceae bacterium]